MKVYVVCQACGNTSIIDTTRIPADGEFKKVTDLVDGLPSYMDYEVWFCDGCWRDIEEKRDTNQLDEDYFIKLFKVTPKEIRKHE